MLPGALPLPPSPAFRLAQPVPPLMAAPAPAPAPGAPQAAPALETTSAGDERPAELGSPTDGPDPEPEAEPEPEADTETEEEKARRLLYCSLCKVAVNSASQLDAHNSGEWSSCSRMRSFGPNIQQNQH